MTHPISKQLAELQLTLGKGPSQDASASGGPVLASDLGTAEAGRRWPAFAPAALHAGAGAIFAFPLRIGAIRVGVLACTGPGPARPGPARTFQLVDALVFADTATLLLPGGQDDTPGNPVGGDRPRRAARTSHCTGPRSTRPPSSSEPALRVHSYDCGLTLSLATFG